LDGVKRSGVLTGRNSFKRNQQKTRFKASRFNEMREKWIIYTLVNK